MLYKLLHQNYDALKFRNFIEIIDELIYFQNYAKKTQVINALLKLLLKSFMKNENKPTSTCINKWIFFYS